MAKKTSNPLLPYENKWVAITPDGKKVIASAKDAKVLDKKLKKLKVKNDEAVMAWVFPFKQSFSPLNV